ncbi:hypothetical protein EVAR_20889_1 [Eumeta japonica]|uniref:Uncharacterized protein n=1 Tax=Eumeta variegata TaxID=151549 RepID=A0A4C1UWP1_EUMVA|nr:hypothetical protein EVAR_20889_1 [Eumeta japonica]
MAMIKGAPARPARARNPSCRRIRASLRRYRAAKAERAARPRAPRHRPRSSLSHPTDVTCALRRRRPSTTTSGCHRSDDAVPHLIGRFSETTLGSRTRTPRARVRRTDAGVSPRVNIKRVVVLVAAVARESWRIRIALISVTEKRHRGRTIFLRPESRGRINRALSSAAFHYEQ